MSADQIKLGCPRCETTFLHSWLYIQGGSIFFCGICPKCASMGDNRLIGFAQEEPLEMGAIIFAIHGNLPCIAFDGQRDFSNLNLVRTHGYGLKELLEFVFGVEESPKKKFKSHRKKK